MITQEEAASMTALRAGPGLTLGKKKTPSIHRAVYELSQEPTGWQSKFNFGFPVLKISERLYLNFTWLSPF